MKRGVLAAFVLALVALTGCNGDDDQDQAVGSTTSSPTTAAAPEEPVDPLCAPADALGEGFTDLVPADGDPEELRRRLTEASEAMAEFQANAPEEIQADVAVLAEGYEDFLTTMEAVDFDLTQLSPSDLVGLDSPELQAASERFDAYRAERCSGGG